MVHLAKLAGTQNVSGEEVIKRATLEKERLIQFEVLQYTSMCSGGQIRSTSYSVLENMNLGLHDTTDNVPNNDDIQTGFELFTTMVYCSEPVAISQFLHSLLSSQSPRTLIQATVNTIESGNIKDTLNQKSMNQFYVALDKIFEFQYGKILLATASPSQLQAMITKDRPYFRPYSKEVYQCFNSSRCHEVSQLITTLGKLMNTAEQVTFFVSRYC